MLTTLGNWIPLVILKRIFKASNNDYDAMLTFTHQWMDDETGDWIIKDDKKVPVKVQQIDDGTWICYSAIKELEVRKSKRQQEIESIDDQIEFLKEKSTVKET